ncbi:MAG: hypothetical protein JST16_04435, partial [Bdellovibrionales bacterium]|nr:hypothetical protein [Bdellovibrionales bacterium]
SSGTSTAKVGSSNSSRYSLNLRIEGFGPAVTNLSGSSRPNPYTDTEADPQKEVYSKNKFSAGYRYGDSASVGIGGETYYLARTGTVFQDPYAFIRDNHLVEAGNFNWDVALRGYAGVSETGKKYHTPFSFRLNQDASYRIQDGPVKVGLYTETQWYYLSEHNPGARTMYYFLAPYTDVRMGSSVSFNLQAKVWAYNNSGHAWNVLSYDPVLVSPGINWNPIKSVTVTPYLDFAVKSLAWNTTAVGLNLNWKVL